MVLRRKISAVLLLCSSVSLCAGYVTRLPQSTRSSLPPRSLSTGMDDTMETDDAEMDNNMQVATEPASFSSYTGRQRRVMSTAIPFLECPKVLQESDLAGNNGFDPLGLAKNQGQLLIYREAEIKHSRLAMLAAIGWPMSELLDRPLASVFNAPSLLDEEDRVPSVLNGGMDRVSPVWWGFCLGLCAAIDLYGVSKSRQNDSTYFPGNLGWDPLGLYPLEEEEQKLMQLAEIKHGRTAMVGVVGYAVEEYLTDVAVVDETPVFFQPITETVEEALQVVAT